MSVQNHFQVPPAFVELLAIDMQQNPGPSEHDELEHPEAASLYNAIKEVLRPDSRVTIVVENP